MFDRFSLMEGARQEVEEGWRRVEEDRGGLRTGGAQLGLDPSKCYQNGARTGGSQNGCKSRKTIFYVFGPFTPFYHRFRLSSMFQTIDIEEIYRLVSKILNFMAYGSVLSRFSIDAR